MTALKFFTHAKVVIWWAGLMRGAVSIALAYNQVTIVSAGYYCLLFWLTKYFLEETVSDWKLIVDLSTLYYYSSHFMV